MTGLFGQSTKVIGRKIENMTQKRKPPKKKRGEAAEEEQMGYS